MAFTVATYNILASAYIRPEWYPGVAKHLLQNESRVPAVVRHVELLDADILCLQEVEPEVFKSLNNRLAELGYFGLFEQKGRGRPDGCATFARNEYFRLVRSRRLEFRDRESTNAEDSGHIGLLLIVQHEGHTLGIANTHIRWSPPNTPREEQVGYRQVVELLEECRRFDPSCDEWVICGDFNCAPDSAVIQTMQDAGFTFAHINSPQIRTAVANGRALLIDYVFHTTGLRARPSLPPAIADDTKLPSEEQPSDHLAVLTALEWTGH
ncbi:MAG: hypothetical protein C0467_01375 [Planctomycetaceae bacterium]|nr:hypothetical protein [Planctomycetaceae bacterium]